MARIRTDISIADFEIGLRDYVTNVEDAYWDLYFAYRDLDIKIKARDLALETWRNIKALNESGKQGGEAEKEAQAREQYFRFQEDVQNALAGRPGEATHTYNGTAPGVFRAIPGVQVAERRLRMLMGVPISDGELLRPSDEPSLAPVRFDWTLVSIDALTRRAELRRQRWVVKSLRVGTRGGPATTSCRTLTSTASTAGAVTARPCSIPMARPTRTTTPLRALPAASTRNGNSAPSSRCRWVSARAMPPCAMPKWRFAGRGPWSARWSGKSFMT